MRNIPFIGVVKNATKALPIEFLRSAPNGERGGHKSLVTTVDSPGAETFQIASVLWVDRTRRYFVSSCGMTENGNVLGRLIWKHEQEESYQAYVRVDILWLVELYYESASMIERYNCVEQHNLDFEEKVQSKEWSFRVNTSILGMTCSEAWWIYVYGQGCGEFVSSDAFSKWLWYKLAFNLYDLIGIRPPNSQESRFDSSAFNGSGCYPFRDKFCCEDCVAPGKDEKVPLECVDFIRS